MPKAHQRRPLVKKNLAPPVAVTAAALGKGLPKSPKAVKRSRAASSKPEQDESTAAKRQHGAPTLKPAAQPEKAVPDVPKMLKASGVVHRQAAYAVFRLLQAQTSRLRGVSLKSLTLAPEVVSKKATHAVVCQVLQYLPVLKPLVQRSALLLEQAGPRQISACTAYVLVFELLMGQGIKQAGPAEHVVLKCKALLKETLQTMLKEAGALTVEELLPEQARTPTVAHPRWARVNLLKSSVAKVLALLKAGAKKGSPVALPEVDTLLPDLLAFPAGTDLHDHPLVLDGTLVLQSKASCMPAHALAPRAGWTVVDCCAAPGNKTTHVAALLGNTGGGRVLAFDQDPARLQRLRANVQLTGAGGTVVAQQADFLSLDPEDPQFAEVRGVILDPSCSGSGTTFTRMDHLLPALASRGAGDGGGGGAGDDGPEGQRVQKLARFQRTALRHALRFPALERLVYSTCSVHAAENELVVADVLQVAAEAGFELEAPFPTWLRRGLPMVEGCVKLIRTDPYEDATDGFFLAVFQRCRPAQSS